MESSVHMKDINIKELTEKLQGDSHLSLFLYTPFCMTCQIAERMLSIVEEMVPSIPLYKCNINLMPELAQNWKIESIPCVAIIYGGKLSQKVYAMRSVEHLYSLLKPLGNPDFIDNGGFHER